MAISKSGRRVAILVAMKTEIGPLLRSIDKRGDRKAWLLKQAWLVNDDALIVVAGIGRKAAAVATRTVIDRYAPALIISAGLAGGLSEKMSIGEVFRPAAVMDAATGERYESKRDSGAAGVLLTTASVLSREEKKQAARQYGADAVDMEAAAVAEIANAAGIPFIAVKAISDESDFEMPPLGQFIDSNGRLHLLKLLGYAALRPRIWPVLSELRRNSQTAAEALAKELEAVLTQSE
jgi:nucleoside phosphorylase